MGWNRISIFTREARVKKDPRVTNASTRCDVQVLGSKFQLMRLLTPYFYVQPTKRSRFDRTTFWKISRAMLSTTTLEMSSLIGARVHQSSFDARDNYVQHITKATLFETVRLTFTTQESWPAV